MKFDYIKGKEVQITKALQLLTLLLICLMVFKVVAFGVTSVSIPARIKAATEGNADDDERVKKHLAKYTDLSEELKKGSLFPKPPRPKPKMPTCIGFIDDGVFFSGKKKAYKVGEKVDGAEIVAIGKNDVTILWEGKEKKLSPFAVANYSPNAKKPPKTSGATASKTPPPQVSVKVAVETPMPQFGRGMGRFGMSNLSPEERRRLMERYRSMSSGGRGGSRGRMGSGRRGR